MGIDFGIATRYVPGSPSYMTTRAGTSAYLAPEILYWQYTEKVDVWSCGVICYILLCGFFPFPGSTDAEIIRAVKLGKYTFPSPYWDS